jgi:hypothetical protein
MKINALENQFIFIGLEKSWLQIVFLGLIHNCLTLPLFTEVPVPSK